MDKRYDPKLRLYNVATANVDVMKLKKTLFQAQPLKPGLILNLFSWERRPYYRFTNGKAKPVSNQTKLWLTAYEALI